MTQEVSAANLHRQVLRALKSDFSYARRDGDGSWVALIHFSPQIMGQFGFTREVLIKYSPHRELQPRVFKTLPQELNRLPGDRSAEDHVFFLSSSDETAHRKLDTWSLESSHLALTFPKEADPQRSASDLLRLLTSRLATRNLYDETLPVTGRDFFGRRQILAQLVDELRQGNVCGVFGLRKIGKTSLVKELGLRFLAGHAESRIFLLRDLESLPSDATQMVPALLSDLRSSLLDEFRRVRVRTHELSNLPTETTISEFKGALRASLTDSDSKNIQVVLALDELESLVGDFAALKSESRPFVAEILGTLRSLVQEHQGFNVVLSGITSAPIESGYLFGRENPLFSWAKSFYVPPLPREEIDQLTEDVGRRMSLAWEGDALSEAYEVGGGNVFLHRTLAAHLVDTVAKESGTRLITGAQVRDSIPSWRRAIAHRAAEMMRSTERHYPTECELLATYLEDPGEFGDLAASFPAEINRLLLLGLLTEDSKGLHAGPLARVTATPRPVGLATRRETSTGLGAGALNLGEILYDDLLSAVAFSASFVFAQLGAFHRLHNVEETLSSAAEARGLEVKRIGPDVEATRQWAEQSNSQSLLLVENFETLLTQGNPESSIQHLRPILLDARHRGARILLLSRVSLSRYPTLNGSSILIDASERFVKPLAREAAGAYGARLGLHGDELARVVEFAGGSRALIEIFSNISSAEIGENEKRREAARREREVAADTLRELGPEVCTWLEHWVFECGHSEITTGDASESMLLTLRMAGVIQPHDEGEVWRILPIRNRTLWVDCLGECLEEVTSPPTAWLRLVEELFSFERELRQMIGADLRLSMGPQWADAALANFADSIVSLARRDTAPRVARLDHVRTPLDWLTLEKLLLVAREQATAVGVFVGHTAGDWESLAQELLPIRNRVAHMRLPRQGDWETLRRHHRMFHMRRRTAETESLATPPPEAKD